MQIRIGNLEVKRIDELNWGVFEVMPEGFDGAKKLKVHRVADDGRILKHTGTYHGTLAEALRRAHRMLVADGTECCGFAVLARLVEESERRVSELAERIGAVARDA